ncbi:hypothetical protein K443DRAFT_569646 [Laccaria amethystina LaAM-08-1]|uniref:Uncharacterized protein n=1 Tax=Laccaria amethystina LaAM-08-1 TaxID=1095629 RepID=A0A0C9WLC4_9AGAR|nr:hypothetical protein K443DRAFT_569646 [Laccaria amethystina LaAM-08-1]
MNKNDRPLTKTTAHEQKQPPPAGNDRLSARERRGPPTNEYGCLRTKTTAHEQKRPPANEDDRPRTKTTTPK